MVGITHYGSYIPLYRLERAAFQRAWGTRQGKGEVAVANYDEDALTLACEAAASCLGAAAPALGGVHFASTSAPYGEKQCAALLATVCDLRRDIFTADFAGSTRCGLSALLAAARSVQAGAAEHVLVTAADVRLAAPESELEGTLGDAAAAFVLGANEVVAELVDAASLSEEFTYLWRTDATRTVQIAGGRFANVYGYERDLGPAIQTLLRRQGLEPAAIAHLALAAPDGRAAADLAVALGFTASQLVESLLPAIGCTGSAEAPLLLARALDRAEPGDLIVAGAFGEGADALLLRVTDAIATRRQATSVQAWIDAKRPLASYERYLKYRRLVEVDEPTDVVTNVLEFKELGQNVRLHGSRCRDCATLQYPVARVCVRCGGRDCLDDAPIARRGAVFTFTVDHLIANLEHPLPMAVVDAEGGGRLYLQVADAEDIEIGEPVVLTWRRLHEGGANHNYYWKARRPR
jgi:3-hydroxy-3-methylglutaryl CoA synthase